jgi:hypothetical protein
MNKNKLGRGMAVVTILIIIGLFFSIDAAAEEEKDKWQFAIEPYLWLPNVNGTLKFGPPPGASGGPEVEIDASDILERLNIAFMFTAEARKGRWSIVTDVMYMDFDGEGSKIKSIDATDRIPVSSTIDAGTETALKGTIWSLGGSYTALQGEAGSLGLLAGFRFFGLKATADWNLTTTVAGSGGSQVFPRSGSVTDKEELWDGIIGVRGRLNLGDSKFYVPYYLDIGTGSSEITSNGMVGLGYGFKWCDLLVAYRYLYYDMDDDKLIQDMTFAGPAFGVIFRF